MLDAARKMRDALVAAGIRVKHRRARRGQPRLQIQRLGDARRAAAHRDRAQGRGQGQRGAGAARQARQGREVLRAAGRHARRRHAMLEEIQKALHERAPAFRDANTNDPPSTTSSSRRSRPALPSPGGAAADCEAKIKEETKATMRCIPLEQPGGEGPCIGTGRPARQVAIFGRGAPSAASATSRRGSASPPSAAAARTRCTSGRRSEAPASLAGSTPSAARTSRGECCFIERPVHSVASD